MVAYASQEVEAVRFYVTEEDNTKKLILLRNDGTFIEASLVGTSSSASLTVRDEGSPVVPTASVLDFVGAGVTVTAPVSGVATITIPGATGGGGLTTEDVQDIVGALVSGGTGINVAYNDAANTFVISVTGLTSANLSDFAEAVQDVLGGLTSGGSGLTMTYSDAGNTWTLDVNVDGTTIEVVTDTLRVKDSSISNAKLSDIATATIKGRITAGTGDPEDLAIPQVKTLLALTSADLSNFTEATQDVIGALASGGSGLTMTYNDGANTWLLDVNVDGTTLEIVADNVRLKDDGVTNSKLANMATATVKGRVTAATGDPEDLTMAQLRGLIALTASDISNFDTQVATTAILKSLIDVKGDLLVGTADNTVARLAVGTNGKVLTADSTVAPGVSWQTPAGGGGGNVATDPIFDAKGDLPVGTGSDTSDNLPVGADKTVLMADASQATGQKWQALTRTTQVFNAAGTGTYTRPADCTMIDVECIGAGGGGGGTSGAASQSAAASGGGSGGYSKKRYMSPSATYAYSVGAGGAGGAAGNNIGANGGSTSFDTGGTPVVANGGNLGPGMGTGTAAAVVESGGGANPGSGGDIMYGGSPAGVGVRLSASVGFAGSGGGSIFGGAARGRVIGDNSTSGNGIAPGSGGAGASSSGASSNRAGGNGADGCIIVTEYYW